MARPKKVVPDYRKHKRSRQAVVTIGGRDVYLGKYGTPASREEYNRQVAELLASGGTLPKSNDLPLVLRSQRPSGRQTTGTYLQRLLLAVGPSKPWPAGLVILERFDSAYPPL